jgi:HK97 gp10 family phage protein
MPILNVELQGAAKLQKALQKYPSISTPIFQRAIEGTAAISAKHTLKNNPVPWRTGALTQTFQFNSEELKATWGPTRFYAIFVHEGTKYQRENPFMPKIMKKAKQEINKLFGQALDLVAQEIAK